MKIVCCFLMFLLGPGYVLSQSNTMYSDSLTEDFIEHIFFNRTKFEFRLSRDQTLLTKGVDAKFTTLKLGVRVKKHYKFGLQFFDMESQDFTVLDNPDVVKYELTFSGFGGYLEYVALKNYRWELSFPLSVSRTQAFAKARGENEEWVVQYDTVSDKFGVLSMSSYASYNLNYWLAIGMGLGYRWSFSTGGLNNQLLNTPFYSLGVKLQVGKLYKSIFHKEQVLYMKSLYYRDRDRVKSENYNKRSRTIYNRKQNKKHKLE